MIPDPDHPQAGGLRGGGRPTSDRAARQDQPGDAGGHCAQVSWRSACPTGGSGTENRTGSAGKDDTPRSYDCEAC